MIQRYCFAPSACKPSLEGQMRRKAAATEQRAIPPETMTIGDVQQLHYFFTESRWYSGNDTDGAERVFFF